MSAPAEALWRNAEIHTLDPERPRAQAMAIGAGRILAVGNDADVAALQGPATVVHDLRGRCVLPGLIDGHAHPLWGAIRDRFEVYVGYGAALPALLQAVQQRCATRPPGEWISGGPWQMGQREAMGASPRALLDRYAPDHPVVLRDMTYHTAWANSAALRLAGVTRDTPDPAGGRIGRDAGTGEPDGLLYEKAQQFVRAFIAPSPAQLRQAVRLARDTLHALGITGCKDAGSSEAMLAAYADADAAGELQLHVAAHMIGRGFDLDQPVPLDTLIAWRERYRRPHVHTAFIKLFLDGVAPTHTAAFFEPYANCLACDTVPHNPDAQLLIEPAELQRELVALDRAGFTVKMHAVGDRAANAGLDAIAAARAANGASGLRHEIGHCSFVRASDHARFAVLGATAEVSPRLWFANPITPMQVVALGARRTDRCHQIRALLDAGAEVVYGSDWPAAAIDANPWIGLAGMVTRKHPLGLFEGAVGADQAITLEQALPLFTRNAARAMGLEHRTGMLRAGLSADFVVLEASIGEMSPRELASVRPLRTVFEGSTVFEQ